MKFHVRYVALFRHRNQVLRVVLEGRSLQEYPVNTAVPQGSTRGPTLCTLYLNDLPDDAFSSIAIYADDTNLLL